MFEITKESIIHARTYMTLEDKIAFSARAAEICCDDAQISADYGGARLSLPDRKLRNLAMQSRLMMGVLLGWYLQMPIDPLDGEDYLMAQDDYNRAAMQHPINRLERLKSDPEVRDVVFDLMRDYRDLERMVCAEIDTALSLHNDILMRTLLVLTQTASPAALQELSQMEQGLKEQAARIRMTAQDILSREPAAEA